MLKDVKLLFIIAVAPKLSLSLIKLFCCFFIGNKIGVLFEEIFPILKFCTFIIYLTHEISLYRMICLCLLYK
jgi:hypothetical protein